MTVHGLVAQFLRENNYVETLRAFEAEHGRPIPSNGLNSESLENILAERRAFQQPEVAEDLVDPGLVAFRDKLLVAWNYPYPNKAVLVDTKSSGLVISSACLYYDNRNILLASTSKMQIVVMNLGYFALENISRVSVGRAVVKKIVPLPNERVALVAMDGMVYIVQIKALFLGEFASIAKIRAHTKLIIDMVHVRVKDTDFLISMSRDLTVKVFQVENEITLVSEYKMATLGSSLGAINYQDQLAVILGKMDHTLLEVLVLKDTLSPRYKISLNDAEFSAYLFSPHSIRILNTTGVPLIAVATSHEPYMRLIVVSLKDIEAIKEQDVTPTLLNQMLLNISTLSPQDKFSQPLIEWRPDGSGIWVAGDDGVIRGIDLTTKAVTVELREHKHRIKSLSIGWNGDDEALFSSDSDLKSIVRMID